jgi:hypothetical protein
MLMNGTYPGSSKRQENPWQTHHDVKATEAAIKQMLWNGTPDWYTHPEDYKNFAKETFLAEKETSDNQVRGYRMDDQEKLVNQKARFVNPIGTRDFIKKLRDNGVRCFTIDNGMPSTVGLWAYRPNYDLLGAIPVCYIQIPAMIEWSVLRLDDHGLPAGEAFRGWRTVLSQLILKSVLTEEQAHEIFGAPTDSPVSSRYRRTLYFFRNNGSREPQKSLLAS